jgi:GWxTD domain-containing protein
MLVCILSLLLLTKPVSVITEDGIGFNFTLDCATFRESVDSVQIEFYLKIPYSTLIFERLDSAFVGRYRVSAQIKGRYNEPIVDRIWEKVVRVQDYADSKQISENEVSQFNLKLDASKEKKLIASLKIEDMNSTKYKELSFWIDLPNQLSDMRLKKSGKLNPGHSYTATDTIEVYWETYFLNSPQANNPQCSLAILKDRKVLASYSFLPCTIRQGTGIKINEYQAKIPLGDIMELESGTYLLQLLETRFGLKAVEMTITNPFYLSTKEYLAKVDELCYIASEEEMRQLRNAKPSERQKLWQEFWQKKDPTPTTEENEAMDDYFNRIEYCKKHFSKGDKGYKSDRAKVYMKFGPPDQIESNPFERQSQPYEIWYYYNQNRRFVFVDSFGFGEYILTSGQEYLR